MPMKKWTPRLDPIPAHFLEVPPGNPLLRIRQLNSASKRKAAFYVARVRIDTMGLIRRFP
jgi:DNA-binding GntR family transcriptional regulator